MNFTTRDEGSIALAERIIAVLAEGRFTATYKFTVLIGLIDLCMEQTSKNGAAPDFVTTRQLAEKIIEIYWPHTSAWKLGTGDEKILLQNASRRNSQAEIVSDIGKFRGSKTIGISKTLHECRTIHAGRYRQLVDRIERKLIEMPLARLQYVAEHEMRFLYDIDWTRADIEGGEWKTLHKRVVDYQKTGSGDFDNRILFRTGVGDRLVQLNGLLRPLIHTQWASKVGQLNGFPDSQLEEFLFGSTRIATAAIRSDLLDTQHGRCFFCDRGISNPASGEVDHFVPWARYPDNSLSNLVVAHDTCNRSKKHYLAAHEHLAHWHELKKDIPRLQSIATQHQWELHPGQTTGIARAVYLGLPSDARLWVSGKSFEQIDRDTVLGILRAV